MSEKSDYTVVVLISLTPFTVTVLLVLWQIVYINRPLPEHLFILFAGVTTVTVSIYIMALPWIVRYLWDTFRPDERSLRLNQR